MNIKHTIWPLLMAVCLTACTHDEPIMPVQAPDALLLGEGMWGHNNASLSLVNTTAGEVQNDWFAYCNNRGLGDLGQDMLIVGQTAYVTVSESESLEVIDLTNGHSTRIDMGSLYPRFLACDGNKLYVSCYNPHCVVRMNLATLAFEDTCLLGAYNPEGIAIVGDKLVATSSFVLSNNGQASYDNHLYIIDLVGFDIDTALQVGSNPNRVVRLDSHRAAFAYWGDYASNPAGAAIIDINTLEISKLDVPLYFLTTANETLYGYTYDYTQRTAHFYRIDPGTLSPTQLLEDQDVGVPYCMAVNPATEEVLVANDGNYQSNGTLYCFTSSGTQRWSAEVCMLPSKLLFFNS